MDQWPQILNRKTAIHGPIKLIRETPRRKLVAYFVMMSRVVSSIFRKTGADSVFEKETRN